VKNVLKLMSKPALAEQAGRMAIENCVIVLVLSLAAVSASASMPSWSHGFLTIFSVIVRDIVYDLHWLIIIIIIIIIIIVIISIFVKHHKVITSEALAYTGCDPHPRSYLSCVR